MIQKRKNFLRWSITFYDILIIAVTYWAAVFLRIYFQSGGLQIPDWYLPLYIKIFPIFMVTFIPIIIINNTSLQTISLDKYNYYFRTILTLFLGILISISILYYFKLFTQSRIALIIFFTLSSIFMIIMRERISSSDYNKIKTVIFGSRARAEKIRKNLSSHEFFDIEITEFLKEDSKNNYDYLKNNPIDWVVITGREHKNIIKTCEKLGIPVSYYLKDDFGAISSFLTAENFYDSPLLTFHPTMTKNFQLLIKYTADRIIAFVLLLLFLPLMIITSILIKLTTRGPVIYRHERAGLNGRRFNMLKFRTMYENAEDIKESLEDINEMDRVAFKIRNDPRITRVGKILRKFSIDELPQLINVLKGEMSMVGPRPPLVEEVNQYDGWERKRLSMKPGLTCLWQISGRSKLTFEKWMELDLEYIDNWSLFLDLIILIKTVPVVLSGRGAY